jgi:hypothetical protein
MYQKVVCALVAKHARPILTMSTNAVRVGLLVENGETRLASLSERAKPTCAARRAPKTKVNQKIKKSQIRCSELKFLSTSCQNRAIFAFFCYFNFLRFFIFFKNHNRCPRLHTCLRPYLFLAKFKILRFLMKIRKSTILDAILTKIEL